MLVAANFALSGQLAWTPGGSGVAFGRMMQDGIVARYLSDHCPHESLKLCPYRDKLPATADEFLWGNSMFNTLGRFEGTERRDGLHRRAFARRLSGSGRPRPRCERPRSNCVHVATGEGTNGWIPHTYGIIERYIPAQLKPMRAARQQHWDVDFDRDQLAARPRRAGLDAGAGRVCSATRCDAAGVTI